MKEQINVSFAGLPIGILSESDYMRNFCRDYITGKEPLFTVEASEEEILAEMAEAQTRTSRDYAESLCIYRAIAEIIPLYGGMVFHGAAVKYGKKAYIFTAPSGTGKSTHINLWRRFLGERVGIINGDKPIIRISEEEITVWGTPYAGKEKWQKNTSAPLGGICVLSQGTDNTVSELPRDERFMKLYMQTYRPKEKEAAEKTLSQVISLCSAPCYSISCDMTENAVRATFEALTGEKYEV